LWHIDPFLRRDLEINDETCLYNNKVTVGNGVFYVVCAKELSERVKLKTAGWKKA
jgi:hypothetical protein